MDATSLADFETCPLNRMLNKVNEYKGEGKYVILVDKTGNAGTMFSYKH